jgi:tetrahydromethanopterin S-methyltransferase subunit G
MNETHGVWWNILDTVVGAIVGIASALGTCFGWVSSKFKEVNTRMDELEKDFNIRNQISATSIAKLEAYHESNTQRLDSIEDTTKNIDGKLDRLIESLSNRKRR